MNSGQTPTLSKGRVQGGPQLRKGHVLADNSVEECGNVVSSTIVFLIRVASPESSRLKMEQTFPLESDATFSSRLAIVDLVRFQGPTN